MEGIREKLPKKEKSISDFSFLQGDVACESPLTCLNSVCVNGLSEAQFKDGSHPCISVTVEKSPTPRRPGSLGTVVKKIQGLGNVESGTTQDFLGM